MSTDLPVVQPRRRSAWRRVVVENLLVLAAFAAAGAAGGWLWSQWWDAPLGTVDQNGRWLYNDYVELSRVFSGTGLYTVIGAVAGVVLGIVVALVCRAAELVTLVAVLAGSALAAFVAHAVGMAQSPVNPHVLALVAAPGTELPDHLTLAGPTPYISWVLGAMIGLSVTYLFTTGVSAGVTEARRLDVQAAPTVPVAPDPTTRPA